MIDPNSVSYYFDKIVEINSLSKETASLLRKYSLELQDMEYPTSNDSTKQLLLELIIRISGTIGELENLADNTEQIGDNLYNEWK